MAKAIELLVGKEFVAERDTDEVRTTWILRTLTGMEFAKVTSRGFVDLEMAVELGLTGWKDFPDEEGNEIEFSIKNMAHIPAAIVQDIYYELERMSLLTEKERKNS